MRQVDRREILKGGLGLAMLLVLPAQARANVFTPAPAARRRIGFHNLHTGESCAVDYMVDGAYVPAALQQINVVLRDHRTQSMHTMDPALIDLLHSVHTRLDSKAPFQIISGYRAPESNAALHAHSNGVATHSMHMEGRAADIRLADRDIHGIREAALALNLGGVGYYPASDFVHLDTGRVRRW